MAAIVSLAIPIQHGTYQQEHVFNAMWDAPIGADEILSIAPIPPVFFPPVPLRRWITGFAIRAIAGVG